ncbi:uncharacterized protein LOC100883287 isoform X2 [Megachile rotundata]|uniref:uncharacterized protein LOC100883287 isoform X2 n=1 Tax=Megachile rotundata TaxID=143995 RepID=UPI003FCEE8DB
MFILTLVWLVLILSRGRAHRSVDGLNVDTKNWDQFLFAFKDYDESPNYDITRWTRQLHLQQCAFVEIGEGFCALFVELRSIPSESKVLDNSGVREFFLGICPCLTLHNWDLCSPELTDQRKAHCTFNEATPYSNTSARVHRRLCDVTLLIENAVNCFPTCFLNPLPESLCSPRNVCGIAQCSATTIKGIHTPQCTSNCHQRQPFCEEIGPWTSIPPEINSLWSRWSSPKCNNTCGKGFMVAIASCQDQVTGKPMIDCIGPGSFCCPDNIGKCYCEVNIVDGIMRAARFTEPCISTEGCTPSNVGPFTFEGELDPGSSIDFEEAYENNDRERFEDALYYPESVLPAKRHLLQAYSRRSVQEHESCKNRPSKENFKHNRRYRSILRSRLNDDANYDQLQEEEDEEDEGRDEDYGDNDERADDEEDEEDEDETIGLRGSAKGRRSPGKRIRETKSDYAAVVFEGRPEVDELEMAPTEIGSEDCDDETTEPLQYYDYDSGVNTFFNIQLTFALKLVTLNIVLWFS